MTDIFDYIFYRVFKFYQNRDGTPQIYASGVVSVIQFFALLSGLAVVRLFVDFPIPTKYFVIPIIVGLIAINWIRYERKTNFDAFDERWGNEDINKGKIKGRLIVILIILVISFPILIGILKHNLGII